uniref:HD domain protein n=1 Tax=uncultured beta proteobacterium TaxID=86027 RepID=H5SNZ3_9PROT|nr:HD domain protein [uncultured beta proteobacterium]
MRERRDPLPEVFLDQLRPGVHIELDLPWLDHPFWFNAFTIKDEAQLAQLKALGVSKVRWNPKKSQVPPLPPPPEGTAHPPAESLQAARDAKVQAQITAQRAAKRQQHEAVVAMRRTLARCQEAYQETTERTRAALAAIDRGQPDGARLARDVAAEAASRFTPQAEVVLQLIAEHAHDEGATGHALNTMVVAQMFAHRMGFDQSQIEAVGTAALLHDIGKARIPTSVLYNTQRSRAEERLYRLHPVYGAEWLAEIPGISEAIRFWIRAHHERLDGKGFPDGLAGDAVPLAAQIIGLANRFDNLCNPIPGVRALPPAKAVAWLFRHEKGAWDETLFATFVKLIGVYPPGTFVRLSNDVVGLVLRNSARDPLRPWVLLYEPETPRSELVAIDLTTVPDVTIAEAVPPERLPPEVVETLDPRCKVRYFHDVAR